MARRRAAEVVRVRLLTLARAGVFFLLAVAVRVGVRAGAVALAFWARLVTGARLAAALPRVAGSADDAATSVASTAANALVSARRIRWRPGMSPYGRSENRPRVTEVSAL